MNETPMNTTIDTSATRMQRFLAATIDALIIMVVTIPAMYFTGGFALVSEGGQPSWIHGFVIALIGVAFFVLINGKLLLSKGQTIGKQVIKIKITDLHDNLPTKDALLKRYALYFGVGQIPMMGPIASMVNILFIFGKEKRCGHDYLAETKVVVA